jgi:type II secretory pathway pseudopilin PulG
MKNLFKSRGFTLVETLLYIGIASILLTSVAAITINILSNKASLTAMEEVSQNARFGMEKVTFVIRNADSINTPTQGNTGTLLSLAMPDAAQNPTVFSVNNGILQIQEGSNSAVALTTSSVNIPTIQFSNVSYPDTPGVIRTEFTLEAQNDSDRREFEFSRTFFTTASVRKK